MKKMRKLMTVLLTFVMVLGLGVTAGAAETTYTITINSEREGHTYEAYQIFKGDLAGNVLSNIEWGDGISATAQLLDDLKADKTFGEGTDNIFNEITDFNDAAAIAEKLNNETDDSAKAQAFAKIVGKYLATIPSGTSTENKDEDNAGKTKNYTISGLEAGYYLVKDKDGNIPEQDAYTRFILQVVGDTSVKPKSDIPTIDKVIVDDAKEMETNEASIGDTVTYKLTSKVPDMTGYEKYYFIIHDTLSKGLTYDASKAQLTVKIGDDVLDATDDYTATATPVTDKDGNETGGTELKIVFKNFIQYKDNTVDKRDIVVTYNAILNEEANIGTANPNTVKLEYSNDPNFTYKGEDEPNPDEPDDNEPTGKTPEQVVETFTTGLTITKVGEDGKTPLAGAEFTLEGEGMNIVLVKEEKFTADVDGTWYKLKNGTYTETAPTGNDDKYDSTTIKYKREEVVTAKGIGKKEETVKGIVDNEKGTLTFTGLGAGTYTLTETKTPEGYNTIEPIIFTISFDTENKVFKCEDNANITLNTTNKMFETTIKNLPGSVLPGTGGIGTTIFYIAGTILVLAAAVLLITKRRMAQK